jgi:hypothetical protein
MGEIKNKDSTVIILIVLLLWIFFFGCTTAPTSAPVMESSGDDQYSKLWEKLIGWRLTSANYALGWYVLKTKEGEKVLYHGGATKFFIADVYVSPDYGSGILLATNARTSHIPLYEGAKRINANYSLKISLP